MLILPRYNDIFGYFMTISLYRESRYNDLIPLLPWHIIISGFHCINTTNHKYYSTKSANKRLTRNWDSILNQNYSNILNPKTKQIQMKVGWVGQVSQWPMTTKTIELSMPRVRKTPTHSNPAMCENIFFCFFPFSASKKTHILPMLFQL